MAKRLYQWEVGEVGGGYHGGQARTLRGACMTARRELEAMGRFGTSARVLVVPSDPTGQAVTVARWGWAPSARRGQVARVARINL